MTAELVLPVGLRMHEPPVPELSEGYEVRRRDDEDAPHFFFYAQLSVLRVERVIEQALALMPARCRAVLELRRTDAQMDADPDGPQQDRYVGALVPRAEIAAVFDRYRFQILHDGMTGFGFYDPESPLEVFLDDHKLLSMFSSDLAPFDEILAGLGVPRRRRLMTVLDIEHEHQCLAAVPDATACRRHEWLRRRKYDVDWFGGAIRRRLRMRLEPNPVAGKPADADRDEG
jgi:hypothetical protein